MWVYFVRVQYFNNTRPVETVYERFLRQGSYTRDIGIFGRYYSIDFSKEPDEEALLQRVQRQLNELAAKHNIRLGITAWRLVQYVRLSWYHWIRVTPLGTQPSAQTATTYRSGAISPVSTYSAPPALPTQQLTQSHQAPAPPHPRVQMPPPSFPPSYPSAQTSMLSQAPSQPAGSLNGSQGQQAPSSLTQPLDVVEPRTPSISSFRVSRDASGGRLARRNASGSVYARSATAPQSESSSGLSRTTNEPPTSNTTGAELIRQGQKLIELRQQEVDSRQRVDDVTIDESARITDLTATFMQAQFGLNQQETAQRTYLNQQRLQLDQLHNQLEHQRSQLEQQRLQLELMRSQNEQQRSQLLVERLALQSVASQMAAGATPTRPSALTIGSPARRSSQSDNSSSQSLP
ncbi:hypothetical protein FRC07_013607, partial [Ceratobasidium sp. 392]